MPQPIASYFKIRRHSVTFCNLIQVIMIFDSSTSHTDTSFLLRPTLKSKYKQARNINLQPVLIKSFNVDAL